MKEEYDISYNDGIVGKVQLRKEGMFYRLFCKCKLENKDTVCLFYADELKEINLGICDCDGNEFIKRMNSRDITNGSFIIKGKQIEDEQKVYYIDEYADPLIIMDNLPSLRLRKENGRLSLLIVPLVQD